MQIKFYLDEENLVYIFNRKGDSEIMEITILNDNEIIMTDERQIEFYSEYGTIADVLEIQGKLYILERKYEDEDLLNWFEVSEIEDDSK
jgi:hypothetical protein